MSMSSNRFEACMIVWVGNVRYSSRANNLCRLTNKPCSCSETTGLSCSLVGSMDLNHFTRCDDTATKDEIAGFSFVGTRDSVLEVGQSRQELANNVTI